MMARRWGMAQMPRDAQVTLPRTAAGHTLTWGPAGVLVGLVWSIGSTTTTCPTPRAAWLRSLADRLTANPGSLSDSGF